MQLKTWIIYLHLLACVALMSVGCATSSGGFPKRSVNEQETIDALAKQFAANCIIDDYFDPQKTPPDKRQAARDQIVNGRMALVDANYRVFVREFVLQKQTLDTASDITVISLGAAGALLTPTSTTRILAAISGGITGSKSSYEKNFYYEQTVKALYAAMEAQRKQVKVRIINGLKLDDSQYPLEQALSDLDDLYNAGTFLGALQSIQKDAGVKEVAAQEAIDEAVKGLGDKVKKDQALAEVIIAADLPLARSRILGWYNNLAAGSRDRIVLQQWMLNRITPMPASLITSGSPDPVKWLSTDASVPESDRASITHLAAMVAGLNNPVGNQPALVKGNLIDVLLGK